METQVALITMPRTVRELAFIDCDEFLIVDGLQQLVKVRVSDARGFVPSLLRLCDGTRNMEEICGLLGDISPALVRAATLELFRSGIIEDNDSNTSNIPSLSFFRRFAGLNRQNTSGYAAFDQLCSIKVRIVSPSNSQVFSQNLADLLEQTGFRDVIALAAGSLPHPEICVGGQRLVVVSVAPSNLDFEWNSLVNVWAQETGSSWLRTVLYEESRHTEVGPFFETIKTPCFGCFNKCHPQSKPHRSKARPVERQNYDWLFAMASLELVSHVTSVFPARTEKACLSSSIEDCQTKELLYVRSQDCGWCSSHSQKERGARTAQTGVIFEELVARRAERASPLGLEIRQAAVGRRLGSTYKSFPNSAEVELPPQSSNLTEYLGRALGDRSRNSKTPRLNKEDLAVVLGTSIGIKTERNGNTQRWIPNSGNIGSVDAYLVARDVTGLQDGLYYYQRHNHTLARYSQRRFSGPKSSGLEFSRGTLAGSQPGASLFLCCSFGRLYPKYQAFSYRLALFDLGVAIEQIRLICDCVKIFHHIEPTIDAVTISHYLGLDSSSDFCGAVIHLQTTGDGLSSMSLERLHLPLGPGANIATSSMKPAPLLRSYDVDAIMNLLVTDPDTCRSSLNLSRSSREERHLSREVMTFLPSGREALLHPLVHSLSDRKSHREYSQTPVGFEQIGYILRYGFSTHYECSLQGSEQDSPVVALLIARAVRGFGCGVYRYQSGSHSLEKLGETLLDGEMADLFLQGEFGSAPVAIWITCSFDSLERDQAGVHRTLLTKAGAVAHRLALGATRVGLASCIVAGICSPNARVLLKTDSYHRASLLALTLGWAS